MIRLAWLKQGTDFTFTNVPTACWSVGELCCGITCACLPTLRPLMMKVKPRWMTSYATRPKQHSYGGSGEARYGPGMQGNAGVTSSTGAGTHQTAESSITMASLNNYSRLGDEDVERGFSMPVPLCPVHKQGEPSESINIAANSPARAVYKNEGAAPLLQQPQPRPQQSTKGKARDSVNEKAMSILGLGSQAHGVSTHVAGGKAESSVTSRSRSWSKDLGGIGVKRDVMVTTGTIDQVEADDRHLLKALKKPR